MCDSYASRFSTHAAVIACPFFDCFRCSGRDTPANVFALFPDVAELRRREVDFLGFMADCDGVTAREGEGDGSAVGSVARAARSCLHVWTCGFGAACHVGGEYRFARVT